MKRSYYYYLLFLTPILLSSCSIANSYHFPRQEVHFLKNKQEGNISGSVDLNSNTLGLDVNGAYAFSNSGFLTGGFNVYSTASQLAIFKHLGPVDDDGYNNDDVGFDLSGVSGRFGLGTYRNFGRVGYLEVSGEVEMAFNSLEANQPVVNQLKSEWNYNPFSLECNFAVGGNKPNIGIAFAMNVKYVNFGELVPFYYYGGRDQIEINDYVRANIYITPSFCLRAGSGPVKGLFNVGFCAPITEDFEGEPVFKLSAGVAYVFGRKISKEEKEERKARRMDRENM
jgi:hypothetical protein